MPVYQARELAEKKAQKLQEMSESLNAKLVSGEHSYVEVPSNTRSNDLPMLLHVAVYRVVVNYVASSLCTAWWFTVAECSGGSPQPAHR